jgi:hypothetical protein
VGMVTNARPGCQAVEGARRACAEIDRQGMVR